MDADHITMRLVCGEDWSAMATEGRGRHCASCDRTVHDLARYRPEDVDRLTGDADHPACIHMEIAADGVVRTLPSRVGRVLTAAVAVSAAFTALPISVAAAAPDKGTISGRVVTPAKKLRVAAVADGIKRGAAVAKDGRYTIGRLPAGDYRLVFSEAGGRSWTTEQVPVRSGQVTHSNAIDPVAVPSLPPPPRMATAGVPASPRPTKADPQPSVSAPNGS